MKAYIADFNNILIGLKSRVDLARDPREADVLILWQDVRGTMRTLCELNKDFLGKPVLVVQHGRGATRDYLPPNSFPLLADRICVWGESELDRMKRAGYGGRTVVTGSPLAPLLRNLDRKPHKETVIVYTPVIAAHEEAFNLKVFYTLKKLEYDNAIRVLDEHASSLKKGWHAWMVDPDCATENQVPYDLLRNDFFLVSKLTGIHDQKLYHGVQIKTEVTNIIHLENTIKTLSGCDLVIGLEEGTFQLMASSLGIPTIVVNGFEYGDYGGVKDYKAEIIQTPATAFCDLADLSQTITHELKHKNERNHAREEIRRREFDPFPDKDPVETILDLASELAGGNIRKKEVVHGNPTDR
jgi:hypothetical protein